MWKKSNKIDVDDIYSAGVICVFTQKWLHNNLAEINNTVEQLNAVLNSSL